MSPTSAVNSETAAGRSPVDAAPDDVAADRPGSGPSRRSSDQNPFDTVVDLAACQLTPIGEFDLAAVHTFSTVANTLVPTAGGPVRVDMAAVTFIDAAGLGALVGLRNQLTTAGRPLSIIDVSQRLRRTFELAHLSAMLEPA